MKTKVPDLVQAIAEAVADKIGRPAHIVRKNAENWTINDPVLSFFQRGLNKGKTGYRFGLAVYPKENLIMFYMVHSPLIAKTFKDNLKKDPHRILYTIRQCSRFLSEYWFNYDCKKIQGMKEISGETFKKYYDQVKGLIDDGTFQRDLFYTKPNTGKGVGKGPLAGNTFYLPLANDKTIWLGDRQRIAKQIVDAAWPVFLLLYPTQVSERRTGNNLKRALENQKITAKCEIGKIKNLTAEIKKSKCNGAIEASHIKQVSMGGSDQSLNGLWLCKKHHADTEGLLKGNRKLVRFA